jgi:hypothetical protein
LASKLIIDGMEKEITEQDVLKKYFPHFFVSVVAVAKKAFSHYKNGAGIVDSSFIKNLKLRHALSIHYLYFIYALSMLYLCFIYALSMLYLCLIPIDKSFNCSKSDRLPSIDKYFDKFFNLQKTAFEIIYDENPKNRLIEDYLTIFPKLENSNDFDYLRYKESIQPLITIAHNNGFSYINE